MAALAAIPGHDATTFSKLAGFVSSPDDWLAAVSGLQRLPKSAWPKAQAEQLLQRLIQRLEQVPAQARTEDAILGAVQFGGDLASLLPPDLARTASKSLRALGVQVIMLRTVYEQMLYDKNLLVVEAGKPVQLTLQNDDAMQHNLVIVAPGAVEEIGKAAEKLTPEPDANGRLYIPDSSKVLHATKILNSGERAKLSFDAPIEPDDYGYVCTFPGHWMRMRGTLRVVPDLDAYLATHVEPQAPVFTEWTFEQLQPELAKVGSERDLNRGRELFSTLACAQCHKLGSMGYSYGPNLDEVLTRWKGDLSGVLGEILQPSKVIGDRYRNYEFALKDGETTTGMIIEETEENLKIQSGPSDALIQSLPKSRIASRTPQQLSVMPAGLLSTLNREQIVDLLSFVQAGAHHH
jgi:putative heme-binding domain-containing protein